ncbi:uncharacterized protein [Nicotiana sylvestris]|uniref:uncharacterized protein n=1 Tax=Nicotiana sylvestris TaxID=4096 RepID=UPI00388CEAFB
MLLVDDYFRFTWKLFLTSKDEAFGMFIAFVRKTQKQFRNQLASIRSDHGTQFENAKFAEFCDENGINHNFSAPRTPQQNGVVERKNITLDDMARTMLFSRKLPNSFWAEAVNTACYIVNRCMTRPLVEKTPSELLKGRKPNISHLRAFGCKCFVQNNGKNSLGKFDPRSDEGEYEDESIVLVKDLTEASTQVKVEPKEGTCDGTGSSIQGNLTEGSDRRGIETNPLKELVHDPVPQQQNMGETSSRNQLVVKPHKYQSSHHIENIIIDPTSGVKTRSQLKNLCKTRGSKTPHILYSTHGIHFSSDGCKKCLPEWSPERRSDNLQGLHIKQIQNGTMIHQRKYAKELIRKFKMEESKEIYTPIATATKLDIDEPGSSVDQKLYRGMIGSLLYITANRPDIIFSVGLCAHF